MASSKSSEDFPEHVGLDPAGVEALYKKYLDSIHAFKGHFTRKIKAIENLQPVIQNASKKGFHLSSAKDAEAALTTQFDKYVFAINKALALKPDKYDSDWKDVLISAEENYHQYRGLANDLIGECTMEPPPPPQAVAGAAAQDGNGGRRQHWKAQDSLKPDKPLAKQAHPMTVRKWKEDFESFYKASYLEHAELSVQQAFVKKFVATDLMTSLESKIEADTPVFPDEEHPNRKSIFEMIDEEFLVIYPLVSRRIDLFRASQKQGQSASEFVTYLENLGSLADLNNLPVEEILIFRLITGLKDPVVLQEILEMPPADLRQLQLVKKKIQAIEAARATIKATGSKSFQTSANNTSSPNQQSQANQSSSGRGRQGRGRGRGGGRGNNNSRGGRGGNQRSASQGRFVPPPEPPCRKCDGNHVSKDCYLPSSTVCRYCGITGHLEKACYRKKAGRPRKQQDTPNHSRPNSRQPSPDRGGAASSSTSNVNYHFTNRTDSSLPLPRAMIKLSQGPVSTTFDCMLDTGSSKSIVSSDFIEESGFKIDDRNVSQERLSNASGQPMPLDGKVNLVLHFGDKSISTELLVSPALSNDVLLSYTDCVNAGLITINGYGVDHVYFSEEEQSNKTVFYEASEQEEKILSSLKERYKDVLREKISDEPIKCEPMEIVLEGNPRPYQATTTRPTPIHMKEQADEKLKTLIERKVVGEMPANHRAEFVCRAFWVPKANNKDVRLVSDMSPVNRHLKRPVHPFNPINVLIQKIDPKATHFIVVDLLDGYFQVPVKEEDAMKYLSFLLEGGRYYFKRAVMGLNISGDYFTKVTDKALHGLNNTLKLIDDVIISGRSFQELMVNFEALLKRCEEHNIGLSRKKLQVGSCVEFGGFIISKDGVKPCKDRVEAISNFKPPTDVSGLRSFLGLANQLGQFTGKLSTITEPLRDLLKKNAAFTWHEPQVKSFEEIKKLLTSPGLILQHYDPKLQTIVTTDASRSGLGFYITQRDPNEPEKVRLITCGSRSLTPAEKNYSVTELETLGLVWALKKNKYYLQNCKFVCETDHRPILGIMKKPLDQVDNPRLAKFKESLQAFDFSVEWIKGSELLAADCLSRAPMDEAEETEEDVNIELNHSHFSSLVEVPNDKGLCQLLEAAQKDPNYVATIKVLEEGKHPSNLPPSHPARSLQSPWNDLSIFEDPGTKLKLVILNGQRILVPKSERSHILELLHKSHSGYAKTKLLAKNHFFWPGMNKDIVEKVSQCEECLYHMPSQPMEPLIHTIASFPMEHLSLDYFSHGSSDYIACADRFSGFLWCKEMANMTTNMLIKFLKHIFLDFGFPSCIRSDNFKSFQSQEFVEFLEEHGVKLITSSPYNPTSNGHAENAVKTLKTLLDKSKSYNKFLDNLAEWRRTPSPFLNGKSPSELMFQRKTKGFLPILPNVLSQDLEPVQRKYQDKFMNELDALEIGDLVQVQDVRTGKWSEKATVTGRRSTGRSYELEKSDGSAFVRNRRLLRPVPSCREEILPNTCPPFQQATHDKPDPCPPQPASPDPSCLPMPRRSPRLHQSKSTLDTERYSPPQVNFSAGKVIRYFGEQDPVSLLRCRKACFKSI